MKKLLILTALLIAVPAMADDIAKLPEVFVDGQYTPGENTMINGSVLIVTITGGTFTDHSADYAAALALGGYAADIAMDPQMTGWPDISGYKLVIVISNDCWWDESLTDWGAADEAILAGYAGPLVIVGQDYAYMTGPSAWFLGRFNVLSIFQDVNFGSVGMMTLDGRPGGPFEGKDWAAASCCWDVNCWFTDDVTAGDAQTTDWIDTEGYSGHGGAAVADGIYSANAFECWLDMLEYTVNDIIAWLKGGTAIEDASWSQLKDLYR
jgi:hypothetical protein